ncbi:MAG: hypothetical protein CW341_11260 [Bacteroidetes bacterium]|nr:hypothetical protein [Bacteroidota bacterium]
MTDFRPMRRIRQLLNDEEAKKILANGTHGVLAVSGDDDYPYAVPLSYVYANGSLYFHSGHPADAQHEAEKSLSRVLVLRMEIDHLTGKQAIELVNKAAHAL